MRELKFDLNIGDGTTGALLNANPVEFFSKAYLSQDLVDNFRTIPGIKSKTKIATTSFSSILQHSQANFSVGTDQTLSSVEIDVTPVSAMAELNRFEIEASYLSMQMATGAGASYEVQPFMNFYWDQMAQEINQEVSKIMWAGDTTGTTYTGSTAFLALSDGFEKQLNNSATVNTVTYTAVTVANVLNLFSAMYDKLATSAPAVIAQTEKLRFYCAPNVVAAYRRAVAAGNTIANVTKNLDLTYLDIKIVTAPGMDAGKIALGLYTNFIYAFDGASDGKQLKAINLEESVAEPKLRTRTELKLGFKIINDAETVWLK